MPPPATIRYSRPQAVADQIKTLIMDRGLRPGDRLPGESEMIRALGHAKGTVREAFRILETQGLIVTRTGPGGGAFVNEVSGNRARALLANYFYFKDLGIRDIYRLRRLLEPEMVADLAGRLTEADYARLEAVMTGTEPVPHTAEEERANHVASLEFHMVLAEMAENPLLGFLVGFLAGLLRELTVYRRLYDPINPELREAGRHYQRRLLEALRAGDAAAARAIMAEHMETAESLMLAQAEIVRRFLADRDARAR